MSRGGTARLRPIQPSVRARPVQRPRRWGRERRVAVGPRGGARARGRPRVAFRPVVDHQFLNWDDPDVVTANPRLQQPIPELWLGFHRLARWATTSRCRGSRWRRTRDPPSGPGPRCRGPLHALTAGLLLSADRLLLDRGDDDPAKAGSTGAGCSGAFRPHPLRVEPLAWASALPYLLSYALLLGGRRRWLVWRGGHDGVARRQPRHFHRLTTRPRHRAASAAVVIGLVWARHQPRSRPSPASLAVQRFAVIGRGSPALEAAPATRRRSPTSAWAARGLALTHPALYLWRMAVRHGA